MVGYRGMNKRYGKTLQSPFANRAVHNLFDFITALPLVEGIINVRDILISVESQPTALSYYLHQLFD